MRTYNILKAKVKCFHADPEIQALLKELNGNDQTYSGKLERLHERNGQKLQAATFDVEKLALRGYGYQCYDQLTIENICGVREQGVLHAHFPPLLLPIIKPTSLVRPNHEKETP